MKRSTVVVPWRDGLHLRPAAKLVRTAKNFHSAIFLKAGGKIADLRSIVSVISLCATMGATLDLEAMGDDEHDAVRAVERMFSAPGSAHASHTTTEQM